AARSLATSATLQVRAPFSFVRWDQEPARMTTQEATSNPHGEYQQRRQQRLALEVSLLHRERWLGNSRVLVFLAAVVLAVLAFGPHWLSPWWLVLPTVVFSALLVWHERVTRAWIRAGRAAGFYDRGLARLEERWRGTGQAGTRYLDENHPNAQ